MNIFLHIPFTLMSWFPQVFLSFPGSSAPCSRTLSMPRAVNILLTFRVGATSKYTNWIWLWKNVWKILGHYTLAFLQFYFAEFVTHHALFIHPHAQNLLSWAEIQFNYPYSSKTSLGIDHDKLPTKTPKNFNTCKVFTKHLHWISKKITTQITPTPFTPFPLGQPGQFLSETVTNSPL